MERAQTDTDRLLVQRNIILGVLLALAVTAWVLLSWQGGGSDMDMAMASPTMGMRAPLFLMIWVVMMVAMMFPTAAPMILTFHKIQATKRQRGEAFVATWVFVAAYMLVWMLSGVAAYAGALAAEAIATRAVLSPAAAARIGGAVLVIAGLYQLTPFKDLCLSKCRTPISFIMTSWRDGVAGALRMGLLHGGYCLGCCWLLFVILFPLGIMNIAAMAVITLVVFAEKTLPWGRPVARGTAAALVAYGVVVLAVPKVLPTFMADSGVVTTDPAILMDMQNMPMPGSNTAPARQ
jgi:predicted metal-binding membrane protein